ncbi:Transcriptional regulator, LacI family [uncultured delta proteobacterium]|uniref:Transcriptional regulator, LacI family n=1 Tax=uncultured delta proteobacterium TaxID=34034 RepID=A0A212K7V8_9DELT|nr:Transcriptional regulator, LacI family [uncultured delta proteobacterium]
MTTFSKKKPAAPRRPALRKATLADVSRLAGVSPATASMVLNSREGVSFTETTVASVLAAADTLQYKTVARRKTAVSDQKRRTVLIVVPNVTNAYYTTVIQAIQQSAARENCDTAVYTTYRSLDNELAALAFAENAQLAGIIFTMLSHHEEIIPRVNRAIPVVVIGDRRADLNVDTVELNNYNAGSLLAQHMAELGHTHLAYISTSLDENNIIRTQRLKGLRETFLKLRPEGSILVKSRDISPKTELDNMEIEYAIGSELARECFPAKDITAFVAINDLVAYGVIDAVRHAGLSVPGDYSVCGFDNILPSKFSGVSLTTIEHYIKDTGHNAFDILYAKIKGTASSHNITRVEFKHKLIVRESTAPPRKTR